MTSEKLVSSDEPSVCGTAETHLSSRQMQVSLEQRHRVASLAIRRRTRTAGWPSLSYRPLLAGVDLQHAEGGGGAMTDVATLPLFRIRLGNHMCQHGLAEVAGGAG